jgi:glutathione S-transferase
MTLKLYYHPLSSFCHKALIALYEKRTRFEPLVVDFGNPAERAEFNAKWPIGKFPLLEDGPGIYIPESSIIIEYLELHHPGGTKLIPLDPEKALSMRMSDRFLDTYLHYPMQAVVANVLRPDDAKDPFGVGQATKQIKLAYDMCEQKMGDGRTWAMGEDFSIVDCAAAPPLFFANKIIPLGGHKNLAAYLDRLMARPSYARVLKEAEPFMQYFPIKAPFE